jgi:hypothetical protein
VKRSRQVVTGGVADKSVLGGRIHFPAASRYWREDDLSRDHNFYDVAEDQGGPRQPGGDGSWRSN